MDIETKKKYRAWAADPASFSTSKVCALRHNFHEHPLMRLSALAELAQVLYKTQKCRFLKPGATQASEFVHESQSHDGRDIEEVFRRIEEPGSWIALYDVETHPPYAGFLREVIESVRALVDEEQPGLFDIKGFIFISAPPSVTPFHMDRENNFWLQIAGRKTLNVWEPTDRVVVPAPVAEKFMVSGALHEVRLKDGFLDRGHRFDVGPGDGAYFPSLSPHMTRCEPGWTRPGEGVSISIGVVFYTDVTRKHSHVHAGNRLLRKLGLSPKWPGTSALDTLKAQLGNAFVLGRKIFKGQPRPAGF